MNSTGNVKGGFKQSFTYLRRHYLLLAVWGLISIVAFVLHSLGYNIAILSRGHTLSQFIGIIAMVFALSELFIIVTQRWLAFKNKPITEGKMLATVYRLGTILVIVLVLAYGLGGLATFGTYFSLFGGMLLGWSLQAPVSGFAAWILVMIKRPFRLGDRILFPTLGLTGDVVEMGPMYTVLDQVGGSVGSEEAVGRNILLPNAMLFGQVVINYTVQQEAAYFLDEVVVRITYDSDWQTAEKILLNAAEDVTVDIIKQTGQKPYIRSDIYDYGVYLRLRYQTPAQNRAEIAYEINKRIFEEFQKTSLVDFAIPFVYSSRRGLGMKPEESVSGPTQNGDKQIILQIPLNRIRMVQPPGDSQEIRELVESIKKNGLLQPIIVLKHPEEEIYDVVAGHLRVEACKQLGWSQIPALVQNANQCSEKLFKQTNI